jgi:hypothetical protein
MRGPRFTSTGPVQEPPPLASFVSRLGPLVTGFGCTHLHLWMGVREGRTLCTLFCTVRVITGRILRVQIEGAATIHTPLEEETMVAAGSATFKRLTTKEQMDELASRAKNVSLRNELINDRENIKEVRVFVGAGGVELADIFYNDGVRALHGVDGEDALCVG